MTKLRASECIIKPVMDAEIERDFLQENHYQGFIASKICLGLYYKDELVEIMSFGKPRYNNKFDWELLRLCTKKDYQVYGGASKLFKYFTGRVSGRIISYCNESIFTGKVYESLGFTYLGYCNSYHYEKDGIKYNRMMFQKRKCLERWPQYVGTDYTERMIMEEQGYERVQERQGTWVYNCRWCIYRTTNLVNGKTYIGQHCYKDIDDDYLGSGLEILKAIKKYGKENFRKDILLLDIETREEADRFERCAIFFERLNHKAEYNISNGGHDYKGQSVYHTPWNKGRKGLVPWNKGLSGYHNRNKRSEESKQRSSESIKAYYDSNPSAKEEISQRMKGNHNAKAYSLWKCIETGEVKSATEWKALGYRVYRGKTKGKSFVSVR